MINPKSTAAAKADVPNHRERQLLQELRGGGWIKAGMFPPGSVVILNLLNKGWIERQGSEAELIYRITEKGLAAKKAPIP